MNDRVRLPLYQVLSLLVSCAYLQRIKPSERCVKEYRGSTTIFSDGLDTGNEEESNMMRDLMWGIMIDHCFERRIIFAGHIHPTMPEHAGADSS